MSWLGFAFLMSEQCRANLGIPAARAVTCDLTWRFTLGQSLGCQKHVTFMYGGKGIACNLHRYDDQILAEAAGDRLDCSDKGKRTKMVVPDDEVRSMDTDPE